MAIGGEAGDKLWSHECPHVVKVGDWFYLFTTQRYAEQPRSSVYRSRDPPRFAIGDDSNRITVLPVAAPEVIHYRGEWYVHGEFRCSGN